MAQTRKTIGMIIIYTQTTKKKLRYLLFKNNNIIQGTNKAHKKMTVYVMLSCGNG